MSKPDLVDFTSFACVVSALTLLVVAICPSLPLLLAVVAGFAWVCGAGMLG